MVYPYLPLLTYVGFYEQVGGKLTDFIIVLRNSDAVKTFAGNHIYQ